MSKKQFLFLLFCFCLISAHTQKLTGMVLDAKTGQPIESAAVYFDNTTIGTITNSNGKFSISYSDAIQAPLIVSFLGYKSEAIVDYRQKQTIAISLKESVDELNEVLINANDGLTRKQKLKLFRNKFLGLSKNVR